MSLASIADARARFGRPRHKPADEPPLVHGDASQPAAHDRSAVALVVVDGTARRRPVRLERRAQTSATMHEGLQVGDLAILLPGDTLADRVRVRVR
jgi:hypothetical protein